MRVNFWVLTLVLLAAAGCNGGSTVSVDGISQNAPSTNETSTESEETSTESEETTVETDQMTSQEDLVAKYAGATFVSAEQLEVHETASGNPAMGYWTVSFTADTVTWVYSEVVEVGTYAYVDSEKMVANFSGREVVFNGDGTNLTWDSRTYLRTASSVFDSQSSLVNYLDGSTYNSVEEFNLGESPSGELPLGNWSVSFSGNELSLAVEDTVEEGTYSYLSDSSFKVSFFDSEITVYVLFGGQLIVNSVVYQKDYSGLFDSQETLVAFLNATTYKSAGLHQLGETSDGTVAVGHWTIDFTADTFTWAYQDIAEAGTVVFVGEDSFTAVFANREYLIELQLGDIIWDGVRYLREE